MENDGKTEKSDFRHETLKKFFFFFLNLRFFGPEIKGDPNHNSLLDNHQQKRLELTKKDILQD